MGTEHSKDASESEIKNNEGEAADFLAELERTASGLDCAGFSSEAQRFADYAHDLKAGLAWETVWEYILERFSNTGNDNLLDELRASLPDRPASHKITKI